MQLWWLFTERIISNNTYDVTMQAASHDAVPEIFNEEYFQ